MNGWPIIARELRAEARRRTNLTGLLRALTIIVPYQVVLLIWSAAFLAQQAERRFLIHHEQR